MQNRHQPHQRPAHINKGLHHIRPDHRRQSALKRIDQSQQRDDRNRSDLARAQRNRDHNRHGIHAHSLRRRPRQQKQARRHRAQLRTKPPLNQLISRIQLAAKILRQQHKTNNDAPDHVSHHQLQKSKIRIVGQAGNTNDGQRAGLRGHNRQRNCPPRNVAVGEKVVSHRPLPLAKPQPEQRDPRQVSRNNQQVDPIQSQAIPSSRDAACRLSATRHQFAALYKHVPGPNPPENELR